MAHIDRMLAVTVVAIAGVQLSGCGAQPSHNSKVESVHVEHIDGSKLSRVTLTEKAIERIALTTSVVREMEVEGNPGSLLPRTVVPYSAVIYDTQGDAWVYVNGEPRSFLRHPIKIDYIKGDQAILLDGPAKDSVIATVGVAELYGAESGIGH